jgi:hypothetical protein
MIPRRMTRLRRPSEQSPEGAHWEVKILSLYLNTYEALQELARLQLLVYEFLLLFNSFQ